MKEIQLKELQRVIKFIEALGCQYKIITGDGREFGALETKPARSRGPRKHEYGELSNFYRPQLDTKAIVGSVQEISIGHYGPEDIRAGMCAFLTKEWGKGTYTTSINSKNKTIELLRTA